MRVVAIKDKQHENGWAFWEHYEKVKNHITRQSIKLVVEGTRSKERPKLTWVNKIKTDPAVVSAQLGGAKDRVKGVEKIEK